MRVALIFDNTIRPDTTGIYVHRALMQIAEVVHFLPTQIDRIKPEYDLYLQVDDGLTYKWTRPDLHPSAWWVIDTHLQFDWDKEKAVDFDYLFTAQKNGAQHFRLEGFDNVEWLPLACDPDIHRRISNVQTQYNVCFVGNLMPGRRMELIELLKDEIPRVHITKAFFDDMAKVYSQSKIVFNCGIKDDVNMRVFEAMSCGSLLITNAIEDNGQDELFTHGREFITYTSDMDLLQKVHHYLAHDKEREQIALKGMEVTHRDHTYRDRMKTLLSRFKKNTTITIPKLYQTVSKTSIIIVVHNVVEMTKQCINSVLEHTKTPFELIVVDNNSSDGTAEYLESLLQLKSDEFLCDVKIVSNTENWGFPKAVNQGITRVSDDAEFILLLNNDTIVTPNYLNRMLRVFSEDPKVGIVGPGTNNCSGVQRIDQTDYVDIDGLNRFAQNFSNIYNEFTAEVDRLVGFCMLIRRKLIDDIGVLDESFGIGNFEDDDFCTRALQDKWRLLIAGDVFIHHFGQQTFQAAKVDYDNLMKENWLKYLEKYPDGGLHKEALRQEGAHTKAQSALQTRFPTVTN